MFKSSKSEIKALVRLSTMVNTSLDLMEVLDNAMKYVEKLMDAEASSIFEVDYGCSELIFRLARGKKGNRAREIRLSMSEGIAGWVAREGKPLLVRDVRRDKHFSPRVDEHTGFQTRCMACVPIKHKRHLIGVLEVLNKREKPFNRGDLEILTVLANQIGIAMENARLYQRLQEKFTLTTEELKNTQRKVIQSERLVALGRLSQAVAHEVRNPVMSIGGFARRLKKKLPAEDAANKYLDIILKEASHLEKMVQDVEDYTNMREPEFEEVRLKKLIECALKEWWQERAGHNIRVHLDLPDGEITFPGDGWLLSLVLKNLFQNAVEAMPGGGELSISAYPQGPRLVIKVADTGTGIPPESLPQIFDPLFTSKPQSSGLGLTSVHRIISEHNGEIAVESILGEGTAFQIILPLYPNDIQLSLIESRSECGHE